MLQNSAVVAVHELVASPGKDCLEVADEGVVVATVKWRLTLVFRACAGDLM